MAKLPKNVLSFQQFMLRRQVLALFREFLHLIREAPAEERTMMKDWVRTDFKNNKHLTNETDMKMHLSRGRLALREMSAAIHLAK